MAGFALFVGLLALVAAPVIVFAPSPEDRRRTADQIFEELGIGATGPARRRPAGTLVVRLSALTRRVSHPSRIDALSRILNRSGMSWPFETVLAVKAGAAVGGSALGLWVAVAGSFTKGMVLSATMAAVGWFGPDTVLERRARARGELIRRSLPDALDLLAISVEAGVSFEGAMAGAVGDIGGPLGEEFDRTLQEMRLGLSRRQALNNLKDRTSARELSTFVLALLQADSLGISVTQVLRTQAGEMRSVRRRLAREQAAKMPVKLLFPLIFGVFPALLIVVIGPAVVRIIQTLGS